MSEGYGALPAFGLLDRERKSETQSQLSRRGGGTCSAFGLLLSELARHSESNNMCIIAMVAFRGEDFQKQPKIERDKLNFVLKSIGLCSNNSHTYYCPKRNHIKTFVFLNILRCHAQFILETFNNQPVFAMFITLTSFVFFFFFILDLLPFSFFCLSYLFSS